jgi:hypothetical protein
MKEWINEFQAAYKSSINQIPISWDVKNMLNIMEELSSELWNFYQRCFAVYTPTNGWISVSINKQMLVYTAFVTWLRWYIKAEIYSSTILDLGTRWRWMVSFRSWLLYPRGKNPQYSLDRRLCGPQSWSGCCGVERNFLPLPRIEPRPSSP